MYRNLSEEEKEVKTDHGRNRYRNMKEKQAKKMMKKTKLNFSRCALFHMEPSKIW